MLLFSIMAAKSEGFDYLQNGILIAVAMFTSLCWCARFTGVLLNPAIVIVYMIKKQNRLQLKPAIVYIICQFSIALLGTYIGYLVFSPTPFAPYTIQFSQYSTPSLIVTKFFSQFCGSFMYTNILLIFISSDISFAQINIQIWFVLSISLITTSQLTGSEAGVNPALAIAFQLFYCIYGEGGGQGYGTMSYLWIGILGPFAGAAIGALFFQLLYRPMAKVVKQELIQDETKLERRISELMERTQQYQRKISNLSLT